MVYKLIYKGNLQFSLENEDDKVYINSVANIYSSNNVVVWNAFTQLLYPLI